MTRSLLALLSILLPVNGFRAIQAGELDSLHSALARISVSDLKRHCGTLASDAFEGRAAGSQGGQAAAAYLKSELQKVNGVVPGTSSGWAQEFGNNYRNLIAILPGSDPILKQEIIVIGAHYDHVGNGRSGGSLGQVGLIHNGADDNASGSSALLELVDAFAALKTSPRRTLLFAFWDAEEIGLLGSKHWVAQPTHPLKSVKLAVNIDMVGRLIAEKVAVTAWRSAPGLRTRLARHNLNTNLEIQFAPRVISDSDHHSFYVAGIPCLQLDTGIHGDYHRPTDDADKLNYEGLQRLTTLVFGFVGDAANEDSLPSFRREAFTEAPPAWLSPRARNFQARLGVKFDSQHFAANRAVVSEVLQDSAAARGGIRPGDRVVRFAHWDGTSVADLMTIVQVARNPVSIQIERGPAQDSVDIEVELTDPPVRVGIAWEHDNALDEGVVISKIVAESPADRAGLKTGDVLLRLSGNPIGSDEAFRHRLLNDPGPLQLQFERAGRIGELAVPLFDLQPKRKE